jgi:GDPmannose 4,6-dehydratase
MKTAFITGIAGQDGWHLAELLLSKNYKVYGMINGQRNEAAAELQRSFPEIELVRGDLTDSTSLKNAIANTTPDEIYNLGAISFVGMSFDQPELTANITGLGVLRLLESVRSIDKIGSTRIYQASSSEMFGKVRETPQNELTPFYPRSPYGVAKVFGHQIAVNYREAYGMHVSCGILFNHEGEHRGEEFVTRKISKSVAKIKLGFIKEFTLGNLEPKRDWGYAGDYVEAMWLMQQLEKPDDFVIATGETHSVREFVTLALESAGLKGEVEDYVKSDLKLYRPSEVDLLVGNPSKARNILNWKHKTSFKDLVDKMVQHDLRQLAEKSD